MKAIKQLPLFPDAAPQTAPETIEEPRPACPDKARETLMRLYDALPERERRACRIMAVFCSETNITAINRVVGRAMEALGHPDEKWKALPSMIGGIGESFERWKQLGLIENESINRKQVIWRCHPLIVELLIREAIRLKEYPRLGRLRQEVTELSPYTTMIWSHKQSFKSREHFLRELRFALYLGNTHTFQELLESADNNERFGGTMSALVGILFNPFEQTILFTLPPDTVARVLYHAAIFFGEDGGWRATINAALEQAVSRDPDNHILQGLLFLRLLEEDRVFTPPDIFKPKIVTTAPQSAPLFAWAALARGEYEKALSSLESGLKILRLALGKRKAIWLHPYGVFHPLLLLWAAAPRKKILTLIDLIRESGNGMVGNPLSLFLSEQTDVRNSIFDQRHVKLRTDRPAFEVFFLLLLAYWVDPKETAAVYGKTATAKTVKMMENGLLFWAKESASIIREIAPERAQALAALPEPAHPLKNLIRPIPAWELSFAALAEICGAGEAEKQAEKRLIWELSWEKRQKSVRINDIRPLIQSAKGQTWTKGRPVSLKRLKDGDVPEASELDAKASKAIRISNSYYGGAEYLIDEDEMLWNLVGHPFVLKANSGERVEITADEPVVRIDAGKNDFRLTISPFPDLGFDNPIEIKEIAACALSVTRFSEKHLRLAQILGKNGLTAPVAAKDNLMNIVGGLTKIVTVHSDVAGQNADLANLVADSKLYIQIQPDGDGLTLEAQSRPLGAGGVSCAPGVGGIHLFGLRDGKRARVERDVRREAELLANFARRCPALAQGEQIAANRWNVADSRLAMEFLLQISQLRQDDGTDDQENLGKNIIVEWPKGGEKSVFQLPTQAVSMAAARVGDWFELSGQCVVDEDLVLTLKELLKLAAARDGLFIPVNDKKIIALSENFRRRLDDILALSEPKGDGARLPPLAAALLTGMPEEVGAFTDQQGKWRDWAAKIDESQTLSPPVAAAFQGDMRDYQIDGYHWLMRLAHWGAGACLADDMGLGKTIQILALLLARRRGGPALVVAPTSVCANWLAEAARFAPSLSCLELRDGDREKTVASLAAGDVLVASYGILQNEIKMLSKKTWHTIILDEAQAIKNMATRRSAAAMKLTADFRVVTTGTPIENNLGELWNLFRFINPGYLGSIERFNKRFAAPIERQGDLAAKRRLKRLIAPFVLRRRKSQVLTELPAKTEIILRVELKDAERAAYEAIRRQTVTELATDNGEDNRIKIFAALVKMRRACCNAALALNQDRPAPSAKLEAFTEIMAELQAGGHRALVFSQFVGHLTILRARLQEMGVSYQYLDGATPAAERTARVQAFQSGEGDCFLISLKAGGVGLNLTAADYVVHMDPWWNPAVEEQASDRAHRIGQNRPVTVYKIVAKDTVEEKIVDLHAVKRDLAESLLEDSDAPARLSAREMLSLIKNEDDEKNPIPGPILA
ncbi:MAG: DEAD/DEAH box helicase [Desulfobulbaceae bacterium]|nr:DEAD/DEAH box helicase [Desulfobulbaceae bacterium]